jgi:hypothetical protein
MLMATTRRALAALLLLLHIVVVMLVPAADARVEGRAGDGVSHIETQDSRSCPPGHDHLQCEFCRHIGTNLLENLPAQRPGELVFTHAAVRSMQQPVLAAAELFLPVGSRAPPIA